MFGFDEFNATAIPEDMLAADDRTLRLAVPYFTSEEVDRFLRYQEALRDRLMASPIHADQWHAHFSGAHEDALADSGLTVQRHAQVASVASQFATRRASARRLREKQAELRKRIAETEARGDDVSPDDLELDHRLATELAKLELTAPLERRFGKEAIEALKAREERLLELHTAVSRLITQR